MILSIINQLSSTTKTTEKKTILKQHKDNMLLKKVFLYAYSPIIRFNMKQIPEPSFLLLNDEKHTLEEGLDKVYDVLVNQQVRGHKAKSFVSELITNMEPSDQEVLTRVLSKNLKCGVNTALINGVWKDLIKEQPCQLASSFNKKLVSEIFHKHGYAICDLKADGARCMAINENGEVTLVSRNAKEYHGLDDITKVIKEHFDGYVVDGELVYDDGKLADRKTGNGIINKSSKGTITKTEQSNVMFQVWDIIPVDVYFGRTQEGNLPYEERIKVLESLIPENVKCISRIPTEIVKTEDEAKVIYERYISQGLEGIILKDPKSQWEDRRSKGLVKYKMELYADLEIIGYEEGTGKFEGMLGSINVKTSDDKLECNVGTGFNDNQRRELWDIRDTGLIGKIVTVKYNALITSKDSDKYRLFLPVFIGLRDDKDIANDIENMQ